MMYKEEHENEQERKTKIELKILSCLFQVQALRCSQRLKVNEKNVQGQNIAVWWEWNNQTVLEIVKLEAIT